MRNDTLSVVVPTLNEEGNVPELIKRLDRSLSGANVSYEVIVVDDHSTDGTLEKLVELAKDYPLRVFVKQGVRGKTQSLLEGFSYARYDRIAFIDADLQYPPEALPGMLDKLHHGFDIIVADRRVSRGVLWHRNIMSRTFHFFFSRLLHNLDVDTQAGLKLFKSRILTEITVAASPWTFDLEFLLGARNYGYVIGNFPIAFAERRFGHSKISVLRAIFEIAWSATKLRFKRRSPLLIHPETKRTMRGAGVAHFGERFITHTTLPTHISALHTFAPWQKGILFSGAIAVIGGLFFNPLTTGIGIVAILTTFYFVDALFNLFLVMKSLKTPPEIESSIEELRAIDEGTLPVYSVLCPLYKEAHMLPTFVSAMERLDWPKEKLDVLLLLEENDRDTIATAQSMDLPAYVRIVVVPHSMPKTKPKACNYGLSYASGEYVVIYDAEDIPDSLQLKKAYLGFQKAGPAVRCLQAKLNYFNPHQNLLTRLFTAEYSLWFDVILPGLQSINTSIPLGGTSNHFRTRDLLELEGWDPFNVTEDCDLGVRIFKRGYQTAIIDSVTLEEANSNVKNWLRQRSRWIKGYMQTYLVHMRQPLLFVRDNGWHSLVFQIVVGGKIGFMFINPFLWVMTLSYFLLYAFVGPTIEKLYPPVIFYMAATSLVFGNFLYLYYYMIGTVKRGHYAVVKYVFLVPFYWILVSAAALVALYELIVKPHYWQKTHHGLASKPVTEKEKRRLVRLPDAFSFGLPWLPKRPLSFPGAQWLLSKEGIFVYAIAASTVVNFGFNAFLGRALSFEELGLVTLVNTLWYVVMIFFGAFSTTMNHHTAYLSTKENIAASRRFFSYSLERGLKIMLGCATVWFVMTPILSRFFQIENTLTLLLFTPIFIFGLMTAAGRGFLQGTLNFSSAALIFLTEPLVKLCIAWGLVSAELSSWVYLSIPVSIMVTAALALYLVQRTVSYQPEPVIRKRIAFPTGFFTAAILGNISAMIFLSMDMLLVKHYLDPRMAGEYALISLVGKMIYFFGSFASIFLMTFVSRNEGLSVSSRKIFNATYALTFGLVAVGVLFLGVWGDIFVPLLLGDKAFSIVEYLPFYTLALALFTLTGVVAGYHLARREYLFIGISLVSSVAMASGIVFHHETLADIVRIIFFASAGGWVLAETLHIAHRETRFVGRAFRDFWEVFSGRLRVAQAPRIAGVQRILILNWRDMRHRFAGGAELYAEELAREWVRQGNQVTLFCGNDGHSSRYDIVEGVEIVRRGGFYLVYFWAFVYYFFRFRGKYDVIIDCQNGVPFFTPLYAKETVYCLMHHVHQEVFRHSLPKPLAALASFLEKDLMPIVYKDVQFITVSDSSRREMEEIGLGRAGIEVVYPGVHLKHLAVGEKTSHPTILYLGRLKAYKSVDVLIRAFQTVVRERPEARLIIAGSGEEEGYLKRLTQELRLSERQVCFLGRVSEEEKITLLQSSWVVVNPSFMEGWGIVVIEANACGTPVIASDIPGLRDSVRDCATGYLVEYGDSRAFAEHILTIIRDVRLRESLSLEARTWAERFDWKESSLKFLTVIAGKER